MNRTNAIAVLTFSIALAPIRAQRMFAVETFRTVSEVDLATGQRTGAGFTSSNGGTPGDLAYDPAAGRMYMSSSTNDALYVLDMTDWTARLIGDYLLPSVVMVGLELDLSTGTLYGADGTGDIYTIDRSTGAATLVGSTGLTGSTSLGYDPITDTMWLADLNQQNLYTLDRLTAAVSLVGPLTNTSNVSSLAYDVDNQVLYLSDPTADSLFTVDPSTGTATVVGPFGTSQVIGMAYVPGTGRLSREEHGCGLATIFCSGNPNLGGNVNFLVENATGFPFVGFGLASTNVPFCGCTIGHPWSIADLGPGVALSIPSNPGLVGVEVFAQGLDYLGAGGCANPMLVLTDTVTVEIGV